ncbi:MAG: hypothetical protein KC589_10630 [Nanoarchaeota archaeon]|nr:hypothetical protein [Nanoarchaeota archaeon]
MNAKFKNATKKITAVAASAVMVSSAAFAGSLGDYPNNFVSNGKFMGQVVVGSAANAMDTSSAAAVIDDLAAEFSGDSEKVKISYKKTSSKGGETVSGVDPKDTLNFGETLASVADDLDDTVSDIFDDSDLDNNDYTQELFLLNGNFDYRIFDDVSGEETAKDGLYYPANTQFAKYVLDFTDVVDVNSSSARADLVGEEMTIMGNAFTVVEIEDTKLTLIGGSNKVALGEGETVSVDVDGKEYKVTIQSVSDTEVLLTVNGESKSIDEFDVDTVAGVSVAVTDLVDSDRDSVKGYAEVVIGGQKVELSSSKVKINDEDLDDVNDDYEIDVSFTAADLGTTNTADFEGIVITYTVAENVLLGKGDSLSDILFDSFDIVYDGLNDVEYTETTIMTSNDQVTFGGNLFNGEAIPTEIKLTTDDVANVPLYLGSTTKRVWFQGSDLNIINMTTDGRTDAIVYNATSNTVEMNISATTTDVEDNMFFSRVDDDEMYLYKITNVDRTDIEVDFKDIIATKTTSGLDLSDVQNSLELNGAVATVGGTDVLIIDTDNLGVPELYLENELTMNLSSAEVLMFNSTSKSEIVFDYNADIEMDDTGFKTDTFTLTLERAADVDDAIEIKVKAGHDFVNNGGNGDEVEEDSDFDVYVDHYGTMLIIDTDKKDDATIKVPDKEVEGSVSVIFGDVASEMGSITVDSDEVDARKAELVADGYTITGTEDVSSEAVEFDVSAPVMDSDVSGTSDMIVVGGPAVNQVARDLLGISAYDVSQAGVVSGEAVIRYFDDVNSVLVYGYSKEDTLAGVTKLNAGGLSGSEERI